ncbi:unnamed protein product [Prorocentrum cordatum]|uniref:Uncharacterized protein n=1 Tax=Prorocentrum cordatum TaxID=2364126 RepID=A0ABN9XDJ7_9DINO|nr:unnamed protein product [Polarella glacialis]
MQSIASAFGKQTAPPTEQATPPPAATAAGTPSAPAAAEVPQQAAPASKAPEVASATGGVGSAVTGAEVAKDGAANLDEKHPHKAEKEDKGEEEAEDETGPDADVEFGGGDGIGEGGGTRTPITGGVDALASLGLGPAETDVPSWSPGPAPGTPGLPGLKCAPVVKGGHELVLPDPAAEETWGGMGCDDFDCKKCGLTLPSHEKNEDERVSKDTCEKCVRNYKNLTKRWKKNKQLKKWFSDKTEAEKMEWYANHRNQAIPDQRDSKELVRIALTSTKEEGEEARSRTHWKPWPLVARDLALEGFVGRPAQVAEFRRRCMSKQFAVMPDPKNRGQWLIGEYQGIVADQITASRSGAQLAIAALPQDDSANGIAPPDAFMEAIHDSPSAAPMTAESVGNFGAQFNSSLQSQQERKEAQRRYEAMILAEEVEARAHSQGSSGDKVTNIVQARFGAEKAIESQLSKMKAALECQASEALSVKEFIECRVSKEDLESETWSAVYPKLVLVRTKCDEEVARISGRHAELQASVRSVSWDGDVKALRGSLKVLFDSQKEVHSHTVATKRVIQDAKAHFSRKAADASAAGKKRKAESEAPQMEVDLSSNLGPAMQVLAAEARGSPVGVLRDLSELAFGKAVVVSTPSLCKDVAVASGWKACEAWMRTKIESWGSAGASPAYGNVVQPAVLAQIRQLSKLEKKDVGYLFRSAFIASGPKEQALHKTLYGAQCFILPRLHSAVAPLPYGLAEARMILEGEEVILGVKIDTENRGLSNQVEYLKGLSGHDMLTLGRQDGNFCFVLSSGDVAVLPTGYVYAQFRTSLTKGIRWGTSPPWPEELVVVEKTVSAAMEAYQGIRGTLYEEWWKWLSLNAQSGMAA